MINNEESNIKFGEMKRENREGFKQPFQTSGYFH